LPDWPIEARKRARAAFADPDCRAVWNEAAALDAVLDTWTIPPPSGALIARIEAAAPRGSRRRLLWPALAAAAALSGAVAGSVATAAITPTTHHADEATNTAFGALDGDSE
jgi:hypothetical protein